MNFNFSETDNPRVVYQDMRNTSPYWRMDRRIIHPLTERQFGKRFRVGDKIKMRLTNPNNKMYITATIEAIMPYQFAHDSLGAYNRDSTFKNRPFTRVLILKP